jgi:hypothetical protein
MRKHRKILISVLLLAAIGAAAWYLLRRHQGPPEAVRLLPEGELLLYADLRPVHFLDLNQSHPVQVEGDYQQFMDQTGIQIERDLDEVAMSRRETANGGDVESAEIFVGRFDAAKLKDYLQRSSPQTDRYRDLTIYAIPNQGHTVRVCLLDGSRVAVTNMASVDAMQGIIDRMHGSPVGPSLLADYYARVPLGSLAWVIDRIPANSDAAQLPEGLNFSFLANTVAVVSLRYNGSVLFRGDIVTASETEARKVLDSANTFLVIYRSFSHSLDARGNDPDVKAALDSIQAEQKGNVATFTATFSQRFLKKIVSEAQLEGAGAASPSPSPSPTPPKRGRGRKR